LWKSENKITKDDIKIIQNKNLQIFSPIIGDQCWDWQLPCSFNLDKNLKKINYNIFNKKKFYFSIKN